MYRNSH
jgi:hypothetical protein